MLGRLPKLPSVVDTPTQQAKLSIIITARNEAHTMELALPTLLKQDYPNFEIILVNDRSSDNTGEIIDRFAEQDSRIVPIHIDHLPKNWLGKVNALNTAVQKASGDWLLFTDADVHHHAGLWQKAIAYAEQKQFDHLALMPNVPTKGVLLQACITAFAFMFLSSTNVVNIEDPKSKAAIGVGAFNLVRHSAFKQTEGFEWLRMEVGDDYGLGLMMKRAGFHCGFAMAREDLSIDWYPDVKHMVVGLEKNIMAPGTRYETLRLLFNPILFFLAIMAPFMSLLFYEQLYYLTGLVVFATVGLTGIWVSRFDKDMGRNWLLSPIGLIVVMYTFCRACILCLLRDGIIWRDTHYSRKQLQKYQRVKL